MTVTQAFVDRGPIVVIIPGIGGSALADSSGPVWPPSLAQLARPAALIEKLRGPLDPAGIVNDVVFFGGLWTQKSYGRLLSFLSDALGLIEGQNLFAFAYDWRQSNADSAQRLGAYLEEILDRPTSSGREFVLIAHSMGGLVARSFMGQGSRATRRVSALVFLGTPHVGAPGALDTLLGGWAFGPRPLRVAADLYKPLKKSLAELAFTYQSAYELLPQPSYGEGGIVLADGRATNIYADVGWLPHPELGTRLASAKDFHQSLPTAFSPKTWLIAGTHFKTTMYLKSTRLGQGWWKKYRLEHNEVGDGTVPATASEFGELSYLSFTSKHGEIYIHPDVQDLIVKIIQGVQSSKGRRSGGPPGSSGGPPEDPGSPPDEPGGPRLDVALAAEQPFLWADDEAVLNVRIIHNRVRGANVAAQVEHIEISHGGSVKSISPTNRSGSYRAILRMPPEACDAEITVNAEGRQRLSGASLIVPVTSIDEVSRLRDEFALADQPYSRRTGSPVDKLNAALLGRRSQADTLVKGWERLDELDLLSAIKSAEAKSPPKKMSDPGQYLQLPGH